MGLQLSKHRPHAVLQVEDLVDLNFVVQGQPGYANEEVGVGDLILRIDSNDVTHVTFAELHRWLRGDLHSVVQIELRNPRSGSEYTVHVRRHRFHEFDGVGTVTSDAVCSVGRKPTIPDTVSAKHSGAEKLMVPLATNAGTVLSSPSTAPSDSHEPSTKGRVSRLSPGDSLRENHGQGSAEDGRMASVVETFSIRRHRAGKWEWEVHVCERVYVYVCMCVCAHTRMRVCVWVRLRVSR